MEKIFIWIISVWLSFVLIGCGKCEHVYDNGVLTKEPTCTEEGEKIFICSLCGETKRENVVKKDHMYKEVVTKEPTVDEKGEKTFACENCDDSYIEFTPCKDVETYNCEIYESMLVLYTNCDYINALILGNNAITNSTESYKRINELVDVIFSEQLINVKEQVQAAFDNKNYDIISMIYSYRYRYPTILSSEQYKECELLNKIQGVYNYYDGFERNNMQVVIDGYNLSIGRKEYLIDIEKYQPYKENAPNLYDLRFKFESGYLEPAEVIYADGIKITFNDDTYGIYYSDAGLDVLDDEEKRRNELNQIEVQQEQLSNIPKIGMTANEAKETNWGEPNKINKTTYSWGITEQWCYSKNRYIYLEDGIVTAISE